MNAEQFFYKAATIFLLFVMTVGMLGLFGAMLTDAAWERDQRGLCAAKGWVWTYPQGFPQYVKSCVHP